MYGGRMNYLQRLRDMGDAPDGSAQDGGGMGGGPAELRRRFPTGLWNGDGEERMGGPMGGPVGDMPPWGSGGTPGPMPLPPSGPTGWKTPPTGGLDMVGPGGGLGGPQEGAPWGGGGGPMPVPWDRWRQLTMPEAPVYNQNGVRINEPPAKQWDSNSWANAQNGTGTKGGGIDYGPLGQQGNSVWNGTAYVPQGTADPIMQQQRKLFFPQMDPRAIMGGQSGPDTISPHGLDIRMPSPPQGHTPGGPAGPGGMHESQLRSKRQFDNYDNDGIKVGGAISRPGGSTRRPGGFMGGPMGGHQPSPAPRPKPDFGQELGSRSGGGFQWGRNPFRMK
jgi:hypothetical protein